MRKHDPSDLGQVAIVEIVATDQNRTVTMVEVSLNGETLTISDEAHNVTERIRQMATELINEVRNEHGKRT